jgi:hypothetical protein
MSFSENTSLDMPTSTENVSSLVFVKPPEVQEISQNRNIPKSMITAPDDVNIKEIQNHLKNDNDVKDLLNDQYNGDVDGKINDELNRVAKLLELTISKTINKNVDCLVLKTTANDIKKTVKLVLAYKKTLTQNQHKISQDQRIYELGKIKMKNK